VNIDTNCGKNPNFRIWPDIVHELDQDTKEIVLKKLYTKSDGTKKALMEPDQAEPGPSGRQIKWICDKPSETTPSSLWC